MLLQYPHTNSFLISEISTRRKASANATFFGVSEVHGVERQTILW
jgi:hypothetical protein